MPPVYKMNEALKSLKDYWFVLVFIGTIIVGWTNFNARITANETAITDIKQNVAAQTAYTNSSLAQLQTSMVQVQTTLEFIKNNLNK